MTNLELNMILDTIRQKTIAPCIKLIPYRKETTLWNSKLGGLPYLPIGTAYPTTPSGDPLKLLAQLNFSEFPPLEGFPTDGILQIYILPDEVYGVNFNAPTDPTHFRILYHDSIIHDPSKLQVPPPIEVCDSALDEDFPFKGSFALEGYLSYNMLTPSDFRFNAIFLETAATLSPEYATSTNYTDLLDDDQNEMVYTYCEGEGHHIGAYPYFTQYDPREDHFEDYTTLLFQLDSCGEGEDEIIWGDCGVANFFIKPMALLQHDFSDVLYTWDCC